MTTTLEKYMTHEKEKTHWCVGEATEWMNPDSKMRKVYSALRKEINQKPAYQTTDFKTRTPLIWGYGGQEQVGIQVFQWNGSTLVIEYVLDYFFNNGVKRIEGDSSIRDLELTLIPPGTELEKIINRIVKENIKE